MEARHHGPAMGVACALCGILIAASASAVETRSYLALDLAQRMGEACLERAAQEGWKMHVAIVDNGGNLKYYARMDDAQLLSHDIAMMKARTAASIPTSTGQLGESVYGDPDRRPSPLAFVPGVVLFPGGLPIMTADGQHLGGIGISGSTGENDEICAQTGLDAIADEL